MSEKLPEHVFHQFDNLFDKMDGAHFGEAEIAGILHGAKNDGIYPGADYVYRYIQCLQIRLREEKERTLLQKYKRCMARAKWCELDIEQWIEGSFRWQRRKKWHKRWLELAEKLKEEK